MKKIIFYSLLLAFTQVAISSCSKCYECSHVVYIEVNGVLDSTTATDEYCTADNSEIAEKEKQGYTCESQ